MLHGLRTSAAVSIALGLAFWLEIDNAYWAGTTAAIICQPVLGSSLRKALFRSLGTLVGASAMVLLVACLPQDRVGFTIGLASWCALCGFVGHRLTFFAAYGAQLAGYTAAIVAGDVLDHPDLTFNTVLARVTGIEFGIAVATLVLATTSRGGSRERLAAGFTALAADLLASLKAPAPAGSAGSNLLRLSALDIVIDQVTGEAAHWRLRLGPIRAAQNGLFNGLAHVQLLSTPGGQRLWQALLPQRATQEECRAAAAVLVSSPNREARKAGSAVAGIVIALEVAAWLTAPDQPAPARGPACPAPADPLPALLTAGRVCIGVIVAAVIWMATAWPSGPGAITWVAILLLLMSPQQEQAFRAASGFAAGTVLTAVLAVITKFAILPQLQSFWGMSAALGLALIPLSALSTLTRLTFIFSPATVKFVPILAPANQTDYDLTTFYNSALSIIVGCYLAVIALRVMAPIPARIRTRRILAAAVAERSAVMAGTWRPTSDGWCDRMRTHAASLPSSADPANAEDMLILYDQGLDAIRGREPR